jgi:hypothetical protein
LTELSGKLEAEEARVRNSVEPRIIKKMKGKPESKNSDKMEELIGEAVERAKETDSAYLKVKKEADKHIAHWGCHYHGSARVYCMVGYSLAEAMKPLLKTKP